MMDVNGETAPSMNPWRPMTDPVSLKLLGKLSEELSECGSAAARCVIQGIDEAEPETGKVNREWLEDELADLLANAELNIEHFGLNRERIADRAERKKVLLPSWHAMA